MSNDDVIESDVVVVGGGLAGLTAGAVAAGEGARVTVIEAHRRGGRARTSDVGSARFNQGAHALYRHGSGWKVLASLGIEPTGGPPAIAAARGLCGNELAILPTGPIGLARTSLLGAKGKIHFGKLMTKLAKLDATTLAGQSLRTWFDEQDVDERVRALVTALARVATYDPDPASLPADLAVRQVQLGSTGVLYLDGGWQQLVDALNERCAQRGAHVLERDQVTEITNDGSGRWHVRTGSGTHVAAIAVVIAAGGPAACRSLLAATPPPPAWSAVGPDIVASCLDIAASRDADPPILFGVDVPLYLSTHCPPAQLAPAGTTIVHVMRYGGAAEPAAGRAELTALAGRVGLDESVISEQRYLHRMTVIHGRPDVERGLAGRAPVAVGDRDGLFVAGDWVGPEGWLADASLSSGEAAGLLAAAHARLGAPGR